jgi:hypothetical protein
MIAMLSVPATALAGTCTVAISNCAEWVTVGGGPDRSLVYRSYPLDVRNERITRALVIVHDTSRDAEAYFRTGMAAALLAGALDDTLVIAPRFASRNGIGCADNLEAGEANWPCEGNSWRSGGFAAGGTVTSFDLADEILLRIARKSTFPNLSAIVVSGHSAGGQFVTRYQMANRVHDRLGIRVRYVIANPSSYAYPDPVRPVIVPGAPGANGKTAFGPFGERACGSYDRWPYGLANRSGYTEKASAAQLRKQLVRRPATYLLGGLDVLPVGSFDASCAAMAQGPTRLERGRAFAAYVNGQLRARHTVTIVPACGHDARCMFTAEPALPVLFPKP